MSDKCDAARVRILKYISIWRWSFEASSQRMKEEVKTKSCIEKIFGLREF